MRGMFFAAGLAATLLATAQPALAAEPAPAQQTITLDQIARLMIGTWQSNDDARLVREFRPDGTSIDIYEGDDSGPSPGAWSLFNGTSPPKDMAWRKLPTDAVYLKLSSRGDIYLFALTAVNPQTMQMINVDRRQQVTFSRLK